MATTTKTLTPTNQTITLPDMTEKPNASVLVDGIGKDADAINALATQLPKIKTKVVNATTGSTGAVYTDISQINYILGYKMNDANVNLEITGTIAYNGAWFLQTTANNTPVNITVMYHET